MPAPAAAQHPRTVHRHNRHVEGVLKHFDHRPPLLHMNRDDVEATGRVREPMAHHVVEREVHHAAALQPVHGFHRLAVTMAVPGLHFHKHRRRAVAGDDVQFSTPAPVSAGNNCVPAALQFPTREILAGFPEIDSIVRHARARSKRRAIEPRAIPHREHQAHLPRRGCPAQAPLTHENNAETSSRKSTRDTACEPRRRPRGRRPTTSGRSGRGAETLVKQGAAHSSGSTPIAHPPAIASRASGGQ